ncbi:MAG: hypothetical protein ABJD97_05875 [Betaproteobacteria bacterium]
MSQFKKSLATLALLACAAPLSCLAESSVTSVVSDSVSRSSGSISDSITGSSKSSSPDNKQVKGDYKVIDMAAVTERPGMVQLHLQKVAAAAGAGDDVFLMLPRAAADQGHVAKDAVVTALQRPYGIEFASGQPHAAFFLALADDYVRDMKMAPVAL